MPSAKNEPALAPPANNQQSQRENKDPKEDLLDALRCPDRDYESGTLSVEKVQHCLVALRRIVLDVLAGKDERVFHINSRNKNFEDKVGSVSAGVKFIQVCEYRHTQQTWKLEMPTIQSSSKRKRLSDIHARDWGAIPMKYDYWLPQSVEKEDFEKIKTPGGQTEKVLSLLGFAGKFELDFKPAILIVPHQEVNEGFIAAAATDQPTKLALNASKNDFSQLFNDKVQNNTQSPSIDIHVGGEDSLTVLVPPHKYSDPWELGAFPKQHQVIARRLLFSRVRR